MKSALGLLDRVTDRVLGRVDAGACIVEKGCCCKTGKPRWRLDCYGRCFYSASGSCSKGSNCSGV